jgi:hypothetical protein
MVPYIARYAGTNDVLPVRKGPPEPVCTNKSFYGMQ